MTKKERLKKYKPDFSYNRLPIKFKEKFVSALRNEDYAQCTGSLAKEYEGYCCMGVAAKICEVGDNHLIKNYILFGSKGIIKKRLPKELIINDRLNSWFGNLNDSYRLTFPEIADLVEHYL